MKLTEQKNYDEATKTLRISQESNPELTEKIIDKLINFQFGKGAVTMSHELSLCEGIFRIAYEHLEVNTTMDARRQLARILVKVKVSPSLEIALARPNEDSHPSKRAAAIGNWRKELHKSFRNTRNPAHVKVKHYSFIAVHYRSNPFCTPGSFSVDIEANDYIWEFNRDWGNCTNADKGDELFLLEY